MLLVMYDVCLSEDFVSVQLYGIGAVLNFTPQILKQYGVDTLLFQAGIKAESASLLESVITCLPMFPFIVLEMFLMDRARRRYYSYLCTSNRVLRI